MEIHKIEQMLVEAQSTGQKDVKKLIEEILLCEDLNMNYADKEIVRQSMAIGVKVYEAMVKGIGEKNAFELLEEYEEVCDKVRMMEKEHWVRVGIRLGNAFANVISNIMN